MLNEPQVILADEPTGNLDPDNSTGVLESLSRFADAGGIVLMVTHNPDNARYASRCLHMNEGRLS
jgi:putative ABC transport system ATP-binding protein